MIKKMTKKETRTIIYLMIKADPKKFKWSTRLINPIRGLFIEKIEKNND